jgi:sterol desaturase/sphingolipid hydroxylase (fatty acid hydroxylase superfamily)
MLHEAVLIARSTANSLWIALQLLLISGIWFCGLALLVKGQEAIAAARRAAGEARVNLSWLALDVIFVAPLIALLVKSVRFGIAHSPVGTVDGSVWTMAGRGTTFVAVVFLGDFVSYWRHRLEHTRWLWPAHAVHHSDTEMTWLTLARFHPVNRVVTAGVDIAALALLGFPDWALIGNEILRHYYGEFIHADFPWTYGPLGRIFVSPVMHRWHHARDVVGAGNNFATVFSVFDRAFGTYHVPGLCTVPLGVTDKVGTTTLRQLLYPFAAWAGEFRRRPVRDDRPVSLEVNR